MAMSITQGGPGFPYLHPTVHMYMCTGIWSPVDLPLESIPDPELKHIVAKVQIVIFRYTLIMIVEFFSITID